MSKNFRVYKPNNQGTGAASEWQLSRKDTKYNNVMFFLIGAKQTGKDENDNASFAWKDETQKVTMKLGENDIGEVLAVLNGLKDKAGTDQGLFHKNTKGNTVLSFSRYVKDDKFVGYGLRLSKKTTDGLTVQLQHLLSLGEGEILRVLLGEVVKEMYSWDNTQVKETV